MITLRFSTAWGCCDRTIGIENTCTFSYQLQFLIIVVTGVFMNGFGGGGGSLSHKNATFFNLCVKIQGRRVCNPSLLKMLALRSTWQVLTAWYDQKCFFLPKCKNCVVKCLSTNSVEGLTPFTLLLSPSFLEYSKNHHNLVQNPEIIHQKLLPRFGYTHLL